MCQVKNIYLAKLANFSNTSAREMELGSLDCGDDGEYIGIGLMETSGIVVMQDNYVHISTSHHSSKNTDTIGLMRYAIYFPIDTCKG